MIVADIMKELRVTLESALNCKIDNIKFEYKETNFVSTRYSPSTLQQEEITIETVSDSPLDISQIRDGVVIPFMDNKLILSEFSSLLGTQGISHNITFQVR